MTACSGKRNVTVRRPFVRLPVCLSRRHTHRDSPGAASDAATVHFGPTIKRTDIRVQVVTVKLNFNLIKRRKHLVFNNCRTEYIKVHVKRVGLSANFPCPALDLQLTGDYLCGWTFRYKSTPANSACHPFGVDKWVVSCNWMTATSVRGGVIWWTLAKERQAWCDFQVKLCDPCLSALRLCMA